ncbi:MAG: hypothetical protein KF859_05125 [Phycisphaeraceae bacterium]|nr:hypothetical protein [Phycisphaeraceae bacterium]
MKRRAAVVSMLLLGAGVVPVSAAVVEWTDWYAATRDYPSSVAVGQIGGAWNVGVQYNGGAEFVDLGQGINYWVPTAPYLSPGVSNAPATSDMVAISAWPVTHSIAFWPPVTNPLMAVVSLGSSSQSTQWNFSQPFTVLSFGPGYFGGPGTLANTTSNVLTGVEGNGVIQFVGTFSTLTWTVTNGENWAGFTFGLVPTPGTAVVLAFSGLAATRRRR